MPILRSERDSSFDLVSYTMIDILINWLEHEGKNVQSFIDNPQGHVDYNPYANIDFQALQYRVGVINKAVENLRVISKYKSCSGCITRAQHDASLDSIPPVFFQRLLGWIKKQIEDMSKSLKAYTVELPVDEYKGIATFNEKKFKEDLKVYTDSAVGLDIAIKYAIEQAPPSNVVDLSYVVNGSTVTLNWKNPTEFDYSHARILRDGIEVGIANAITTTFSEILNPRTSYNYTIISVDTLNKESTGVSILVQTGEDSLA